MLIETQSVVTLTVASFWLAMSMQGQRIGNDKSCVYTALVIEDTVEAGFGWCHQTQLGFYSNSTVESPATVLVDVSFVHGDTVRCSRFRTKSVLEILCGSILACYDEFILWFRGSSGGLKNCFQVVEPIHGDDLFCQSFVVDQRLTERHFHLVRCIV